MIRTTIVGGTGGIGKALVTHLPAVVGRQYDVTSLGSADFDVADQKAVEDYFRSLQVEKLTPHAVVYSAGVTHGEMLHKTTYNNINHQLSVNALGFLNVLRFVLPGMREQGFGRIIYVSSVLSTKPIAGTSIYSASKAFSDSLVRSCALENASKGVTCNSIQLGYCEVGMISKVSDDVLKWVVDRTPVKRLGKESEVVQAVDFLINNEYATGMMLELSGGLQLI